MTYADEIAELESSWQSILEKHCKEREYRISENMGLSFNISTTECMVVSKNAQTSICSTYIVKTKNQTDKLL